MSQDRRSLITFPGATHKSPSNVRVGLLPLISNKNWRIQTKLKKIMLKNRRYRMHPFNSRNILQHCEPKTSAFSYNSMLLKNPALHLDKNTSPPKNTFIIPPVILHEDALKTFDHRVRTPKKHFDAVQRVRMSYLRMSKARDSRSMATYRKKQRRREGEKILLDSFPEIYIQQQNAGYVRTKTMDTGKSGGTKKTMYSKFNSHIKKEMSEQDIDQRDSQSFIDHEAFMCSLSLPKSVSHRKENSKRVHINLPSTNHKKSGRNSLEGTMFEQFIPLTPSFAGR